MTALLLYLALAQDSSAMLKAHDAAIRATTEHVEAIKVPRRKHRRVWVVVVQ